MTAFNGFSLLVHFLGIVALLALSAAILFAIEIDESNRGFLVSRGVSFYLQVNVMNGIFND